MKAVQLLKTPAKTTRAFITLQISILKDGDSQQADSTAKNDSSAEEENNTHDQDMAKPDSSKPGSTEE